jgi:hypothetical protein
VAQNGAAVRAPQHTDGTMADSTLIVSVTGILVSGVVGPTVTTWSARRASRRQFVRDRAAKRSEELGGILDEADSLLGLGATRLRETREAAEKGTMLSIELQAWPERVYVIGQRLLLRLGAADAVVLAFEQVRLNLVEAGECAVGNEAAHERAVDRFEGAREKFLVAARAKLDAPISEKETP